MGINYKEGQVVQGVVEQVRSFGVYVRLTDGTEAYMRPRELSWASDVDPRELLNLGEALEAAVLIPTSAGKRIELSRRPLLPDPWLQFSQHGRLGDRVSGRVKEILLHGVYVEIEPGVDGYIPKAELATTTVSKPDALLWVDDHVEAIVTYINPRKKNLRLSIRRRLQQLSLASTFVNQLKQKTTAPQIAPAGEEDNFSDNGLTPEEIERVGLILIVEDQIELRTSLAKWLLRQGLSVLSAASMAEALNIAQDEFIDTCFVDIDLPDSDGLSFVQQLNQQQPAARVFVMSIPDWLAERAEEIEELAITAVLLKPLDLKEVLRCLTQDGRSLARQSNLLRNSLSKEAVSGAFNKLSRTMRSPSPPLARLYQGLEKLLQLTSAEAAFLFHMDSVSQKVTVISAAGATTLVNPHALYALPDSPVRDVIHQESPLFVNQVSLENPSRYQKLQEYIPFEATIGVPIQVGETIEHALFIFHRRPNVFSSFRLRDVQALAILFAVTLENQALAGHLEAISGIILSGQLAAGLGHEVFNKISALEIQLLNLYNDYESLNGIKEETLFRSGLQETAGALSEALQTAADMKNTVGLFQSLMRSNEVWETNIDEVIHQAKTQILPILARDKVRLKLETAADLPIVPGSSVHLRQIMLNILLNAAQHIASSESNTLREIEIKTTYDQEDAERPLKIRISDTGPGIHTKLWQRIFSLGFSTREEGTGLGLYIARSLAEHMGGAIKVERSILLLGTTFLVEFPVLSGRKANDSRERTARAHCG